MKVKISKNNSFYLYRFVMDFIILFIFIMQVCFSVDSPIQVQVEPSEVGVGESFEVTVIVRGSNVGEPKFEVSDGIQILPDPVYSGMSTEIRMTFGQSQIITTKERRYRGIANKEGEWSIQVSVFVNGTQQESPDVKIKVVPANSATPTNPQTPSLPQKQQKTPFTRRGQTISPGQRSANNAELDKILKVESEVSKKIVFQGEVLTLILRAKILESQNFSLRTTTGNIPDLPEFEGFYVGKIQQNSRRENTTEGMYKIIELVIPICPKSVGTLTINPWVWDNCYVQYSTWGWPETYPIVKNSEPINLEVRPLPPSPENYFGAIGKYTLTSNVSQTEVKVGTPIYLSMTFRGEGYPDFLRPPAKPNLDWAYISDPEVVLVNAETWDNVEKTFRFSITPMKPGDYQIPSIGYDYFNPQLGQYASLRTNAFPLRVIGDALEGNNVITAGGTPRIEAKTVDVANSELLPIITEGVNLKPVGSHKKLIPYVIFIFPPILSILSLGLGFRKEYLKNNPIYRRKIYAYENCIRKYDELRNMGNISVAVEQALKQYIGDIFGVVNTSGLTSDDVEKIINDKRVDRSLKDRILKILKTCERIRYSGAIVSQEENRGLEDGFRALVEELWRVMK
ncbi:MAG TPA: BatD family protein [Candidatus Hydrogenedens sp.]|nr:BatD family protein [Candidatus Hydrogenedens sp.]HOL19349.1 BatD family protein [Candidatus Hydrogenedens sp.]HPP57949.1 BatD family protein [Candidatus Hydrogenedens sp.]